ncbi:unnamed protein product [Tilletia controversa]|uniref:AAA+ ATPase domain-containing protein n=2 Tax=Tilletia TaxID=13289 RepID=A0A8T8TKM3_9BASI|nr:hypothetical protein A4X03_0g3178 [Tilletia caries]CAD6898461.1 unnamed protein product [Tilletia controversa]CAD6884311.1 unnamed protein product [Tilletia caries]CAD6912420.1 unnamed protein product [Tilletia controversa]CAD6929318.1 unnamed protein product [Tilletia caries]
MRTHAALRVVALPRAAPPVRRLATLSPSSSSSSSSSSSPSSSSSSTSTSDPLAVYKERVARNEIEQSEDQIRALAHLRRLSRALETYTPPAHLLAILARPPPSPEQQQHGSSSATVSTAADPRTAALVQWLTLPQQLAQSPAPQGLLLTGPPGTGKSMLADLFFDSLPLPPTQKWRRHYHHLLLEIYRIVWQEAERRRIATRQGSFYSTSSDQPTDDDLSSSGPRRRTTLPQRGTGVVWKRELASDGQSTVWNRILEGMPFFRSNALSEAPSSISTALTTSNFASSSSANMDLAHTTLPLYAAAELFLRHGHVLLFDELQLVDVASANLLKRVLEAYWRLGGVVVGTSNRLPEELYTRGVQREAMLGFLEALRERCPVHEMRDDRDYRRRPADFSKLAPGSALGRSTYFLSHEKDAFEACCAELVAGRKGSPAEVQVYSRKVPVPFSLPPTPSHPSLARFSFSDLFDTALGPADYLQLASTYHTLILTSLPTLTLLQKNQARRLITFLDAVYEAGCRLVVCAQAEPDRIFFPEASEEAERMVSGQKKEAENGKRAIDLDTSQLIQSEVFSEAAQDTEEGFRPNIVAYSEGDDARGEAARRRRAAAASVGASAGAGGSERSRKEEALKGVYAGITMERDAKGRPIVARDAFGFANLAIFTGEEERFAFQRAVSRLFEMSTPAYTLRKAWRPLDASALDIWGATSVSSQQAIVGDAEREREARVEAVRRAVRVAEAQARREMEGVGAGAGVGSDFADEASFEHRTHRGRDEPTTHPIPIPTSHHEEEPDFNPSPRLHPAFPTTNHANERSVAVGEGDGPPRLSPVHVWGVTKWGAKAGRWGEGAEAYGEGADGVKGRKEEGGEGGERGGKR